MWSFLCTICRNLENETETQKPYEGLNKQMSDRPALHNINDGQRAISWTTLAPTMSRLFTRPTW